VLAAVLIISGAITPLYVTYLLWKIKQQNRKISGLEREVNDVNKLMLKYGKYDERKN
jgi:hypothetical protein